jgi:phosphoribosylamine--glycine ligase
MSDNTVVTSGGRVLCVVGLGESVASAREVAYAQVHLINWNKVFFRNDIGHRAIAREQD